MSVAFLFLVRSKTALPFFPRHLTMSCLDYRPAQSRISGTNFVVLLLLGISVFINYITASVISPEWSPRRLPDRCSTVRANSSGRSQLPPECVLWARFATDLFSARSSKSLGDCQAPSSQNQDTRLSEGVPPPTPK